VIREFLPFTWFDSGSLAKDKHTAVQQYEARLGKYVSGPRQKGYWIEANSAKSGLTEPDVAVILEGWIAARDWFAQNATVSPSDGESFGVGEATGNKHCIAGW
jgi:hypothetical protein